MNDQAVVMIVMGILSVIAFSWISLIAKLIRRNEVLAYEPRRAVPWGILAVLAAFCLFIGSQIAAAAISGVGQGFDPTVSQTRTLLACTAIAIVAGTLVSIGAICLTSKASRKDFGISLDCALHDLGIGVRAFFILGPASFLIQFIFVKLLAFESEHPLIELLKEDGTGTLFGVVTLLAVVVAPISEEYLFRVVLQGWLEKVMKFTASLDSEPRNVVEDDLANREAQVALELNPYSAPEHTADVERSESETVGTISFMPIIISSAVFALMHWSHGPDFVALFVLALGLGYVYQRTHRWLPCVVTHACLNGTTMLMLWIGLE